MSIERILPTVGLLVLVTVVLRITLYVYKHLSLRWKLSSIPGPKTLPFIGLAWKFRKITVEDFFQWAVNLCSQFKGGMVIIWMGPEPYIHIRKPHQLEVIMRSSTLIKKSNLYDFLAYWLGNGLLTSKGDIWRQHRRLITPAFHFGVLDNYIDIFLNKVEIFNSIMKSHVEKNPNEPVNIFAMIIKYTLDITCETIMGVDMDTQRKPQNKYFDSLHRFAELTITRIKQIYYRSNFIFKQTQIGQEYQKCIDDMHAFTTKVISEKRESRQEKKSHSDDVVKHDDSMGKRKVKSFLDLLMDLSEADENPLTDTEIREQVDTFMFAGHDTTGIAISFALYCLGNEPEIQKKVHEELDEILGDNDRFTRKELSELVYLDRTIKEVLRLFPSAPMISRDLEHDVVIDGHVIPKDVSIEINIFHLHRDPEIWENPMKFDPDRFLPENSQGRHPYAYVPFSAGPRNCIGQKFAQLVLKVSLASILKKWNVVSEVKTHDLKLSSQIVLTPQNRTINIFFKPRTNA